MYVPAIHDLARDADMSGAPTRIYLFLLKHLDPLEHRPVKNWALAVELKMKPHTVGRAIDLLVDRGYLELGEWSVAKHARTYRIIYALRERANEVAPATRATAV